MNGQPLTWRDYADERWTSWTAADHLSVDDEPWHTLTPATRNRDSLLLAVAVLVIVALAAFAVGRAS